MGLLDSLDIDCAIDLENVTCVHPFYTYFFYRYRRAIDMDNVNNLISAVRNKHKDVGQAVLEHCLLYAVSKGSDLCAQWLIDEGVHSPCTCNNQTTLAAQANISPLITLAAKHGHR